MIFTPAFMAAEATDMKIAVLSGKGGTGKTLVTVNLAAAAKTATYIDCDVEEPNGHLFFKPEGITEEKVTVKIPIADEELCSGCRKCVNFCKFNALAYTNKLIVFDEICHSCGGCILVCPEKALTEKDKAIGTIQKGTSGNVSVYTGIMNLGEASGVPIIKKLLETENQEADKITVIDCPPGSACIVMESIKDADYCILVAEPTLFGVHNLNMVYELVTLFKKPFGVVLNKCLDGENPAETFCIENNIKILGRIPFDNELGTLNSNAGIVVNESEKYRELFSDLLQTVIKEVQSCGSC
jgi:MinD superfamily P-loop ATPase